MSKMPSSPTGILALPTEIFLDIVSQLRTPDLRRLGRANRGLHTFVGHYLSQYRYNAGLLALPNELLLKIVDHLENQRDRSRLARVSNRLYPLVMNYIVRYDIQHDQSSLLRFVARRNLKAMARQIINLGADVNTGGIKHNQSTPLTVASLFGNTGIAKLLLNAGASRMVQGQPIPLLTAISSRQEHTALMLSRNLDVKELMRYQKTSKKTLLQLACAGQLVNLVEYYLDRGSRCGYPVREFIQDCSISLQILLLRYAIFQDVIKRELHDDVYKVVIMLLQHGANPDYRVHGSDAATARDIAEWHPDPRVRNLLAGKKTPVMALPESDLFIGRPWMIEYEDEALALHNVQSVASNSQASTRLRLSDFLKSSKTEAPELFDEDEDEYEYEVETNAEDESTQFGSLGWSMVDESKPETHWMKKDAHPVEAPPLSAFPQLGTPSRTAQHHLQSTENWAHHLKNVSIIVPLTQRSSMKGASISHTNHSQKLAEVEAFPQLGQPHRASNRSGANVWARLASDRTSSQRDKIHSPGGTSRQENSDEVSVGRQTKKKNKKWKPISF